MVLHRRAKGHCGLPRSVAVCRMPGLRPHAIALVRTRSALITERVLALSTKRRTGSERPATSYPSQPLQELHFLDNHAACPSKTAKSGAGICALMSTALSWPVGLQQRRLAQLFYRLKRAKYLVCNIRYDAR
jgi:hypothetical protein